MLAYLMLINGDEQKKKFSDIYVENRKLLYNICYCIIKDEMDAEGIVHDTFVKIADNFHKYDSWKNEDIKKLSITIVKNLSIDYLRKRNRLSDTDIENVVLYNEYIDFLPEDKIEFDSRKNMIITLLEKLPEIYKEILDLKYYHGLSTNEMAEILNIKPKTVEVRLRRARNKMKELIENEG